MLSSTCTRLESCRQLSLLVNISWLCVSSTQPIKQINNKYAMRCLIFFFSQYWKTTNISSGRQDQLQKRRHIPTLLWGSLIPDMWALWEQWADLCFYPCGWLPARPHTILASIWAVRAAQSLGSQVSALPSPFQPCEGTQRTRTCRLRFRGEDGDLPTALPTPPQMHLGSGQLAAESQHPSSRDHQTFQFWQPCSWLKA